MPHVVVKCYKGRSQEELQKIADEIAVSTAKAFGLKESSVSVAIEQIEKENWETVYHKDIYGNKDSLYVEPGYRM